MIIVSILHIQLQTHWNIFMVRDKGNLTKTDIWAISHTQSKKISSECQSLLQQQHSRHNLEFFIYLFFMKINLHYNGVTLLLDRNEGSCQNPSQFWVSCEILVAPSVSVPMFFFFTLTAMSEGLVSRRVAGGVDFGYSDVFSVCGQSMGAYELWKN